MQPKITLTKGLDDQTIFLLDLRTQVYKNVGKHNSAELMIDQFDECALHIGLWDGDKPIAAARIINQLPSADAWWTGFPLRRLEESPETGPSLRLVPDRHERNTPVRCILHDPANRADDCLQPRS